MNTKFRQIFGNALAEKEGVEVAFVRLEPKEVHRRLGITFESDRNELGEYDFATIVVGESQPFVVCYYYRSPIPGAEIVISADIADKRAELSSILEFLCVAPNDVIWKNPILDRG